MSHRSIETPGGSVSPGDPLFELRLTHEELVQSQVDLLATSEALDVIQRELRRLESINTEGLIAKKRILDQQYELQKLEGRQRRSEAGIAVTWTF